MRRLKDFQKVQTLFPIYIAITYHIYFHTGILKSGTFLIPTTKS